MFQGFITHIFFLTNGNPVQASRAAQGLGLQKEMRGIDIKDGITK